jgi:hypothetical protein
MGCMLPLPFAARGNRSYLDFWVIISGSLYLRYITLSDKLRVARVYNKGVKKKFSVQRPCLETDFVYRVHKQQVWKVVTKLGRTT